MDEMIYKIHKAYGNMIGPIIMGSSIFTIQDERNEQYWLAAMGMYETLSIIGIKFI